MKLLEAIAESAGNKAHAISDQAATIIVQERSISLTHWWFHVWQIHKARVYEFDLSERELHRLKGFDVDPEADYWQPVK